MKPSAIEKWHNIVRTRDASGLGCIHCGHRQPAVDFTEKDLQRYQQFEGEQPGVLECINSEPQKLDQ